MTTTFEEFGRSKTAPRMRHDPLADFDRHDRHDRPPVDVRQAARTVMGVVVLSAGLFVCLWVVYLAHATVFRTEKMELLRRLVPGNKEELVLTLPAGKVELPAGVIRLGAYVLFIPLAYVGAKIGLAMTKEGCWLLRHERITVAEEAPSNFDPSATGKTETAVTT